MAAETVCFDKEVFAKFAFYAGIVLFKTIIMAIWTARYRLPRRVFPTPEDYGNKKPATVTLDPDVERVRRCHQNDLESVLSFVLIGLLYMLTGPDVATATWHFRIFAGTQCTRLLHTIVYLNAVRQPARALMYIIGFGVNVSMVMAVIKAGVF